MYMFRRYLPVMAFCLSIIAIPAPVAAEETPAYLIVQVEVTDWEEFARYQMAAGPTIMAAGGVPVVVTPAVETLEGERVGNFTVVIQFPNLEVARDWYASPAYQDAIPIRQGAATFTNMILAAGFVAPEADDTRE